MSLRGILLSLLAVAAWISGCATDRDERHDPVNDLWRQGYGANNPNADRIRQNKPPVDLNESH